MCNSLEQNLKIARKKLVDKVKQKEEHSEKMEKNSFQGLLFVGNRHETVPLRLLTDKYLSPRAKIAWQMIKLNAYQFQGSVFPSYDELALWLSDRAFQHKSISRKIVSQTLLLLRLTRWLTLCETVRNDRGQVLGNVYVMNDEPLSISDSLQLNGDYLRLLEKSTKHRDPLVKEVALAIIDEMLSSEQSLWHFVSHIDVIRERYIRQQHLLIQPQQAVELPADLAKVVHETEQKLLSSNMELSKKPLNSQSSNMELSKKRILSQSSNMELSQGTQSNPLIYKEVPKRNSVVQYSTNIKYSTSTGLVSRLQKLGVTHLELETVGQMFNQLDEVMQEAVLFEAEQRIGVGNIQKPANYLFSLLKRAMQGEFKPYYATKTKNDEIIKSTSKSEVKMSSSSKTGSARILPQVSIAPNVNSQRQLEMLAKLRQSLH